MLWRKGEENNNCTVTLSCSGYIDLTRKTKSSIISRLKATNINNKSTFVWPYITQLKEEHIQCPLSLFDSDNEKIKRQQYLRWETLIRNNGWLSGGGTGGDKIRGESSCLSRLLGFPFPSIVGLSSPKYRFLKRNMSVTCPPYRAPCAPDRVREAGVECWHPMTEWDEFRKKKFFLFLAERNSSVKKKKFVADRVYFWSTYMHTDTRTPTLGTVLGGLRLAVGLLSGPAQVALHPHKLWGVLLFLLYFLLLQLQLQE